ncbi:MAG TPA: methionine synthase [Archaeoglobaceae archaeon]|nr:methionine synthase [Archaeoglobaceae archaeon]
MLIDDIGSFPLPAGIDREWVSENLKTKEYEEMVQRAFLMKLKAGVECPNYPQFQEMVEQFMGIIRDPDKQDEAYLVSKEAAIIPEVKALEKINYDGIVRICITGPFELYYREFGGVIYSDVLENISISLSRFAANSLDSNLNVKAISIDEPSLGTNPELQPTLDQLQRAFSHFKFDVDVQIHLHSTLFYESLLNVEEIDVFGIEAAKDPSVIESIEPDELESYEKSLRIGIARSDIDSIIAEYNQIHGVNAWQDVNLIGEAIDEFESVETIFSRIKNAYDLFGNSIAYIGPDCGLFSFPAQNLACKLLENVNKAVKKFRKEIWTT